MGDLDEILACQLPSGAFPSSVVRGGAPRGDVDANGLVTVHVVRALAPIDPALWSVARERALGFLERCAIRPGAYGFWPRDGWPSWAPFFGPDVDDTALIAAMLHDAERLAGDELLQVAVTLAGTRVTATDPGAPSWVGVGAFRTWIDRPGIVDCAVNANVAGYLASAGWRGHFGYGAAVATVEAGLAWADGSWSRLAGIAPFYPHPGELYLAVSEAVRRGAEELRPALEALERAHGEDLVGGPETSICSSAYGLIRWYAPVVARARALTGLTGGTPAT